MNNYGIPDSDFVFTNRKSGILKFKPTQKKRKLGNSKTTADFH